MSYQTVNPGLEKVIVAETAISDLRGEEGRLIYRGFDIEELVKRPFAQVAWLLLFDEKADNEKQTLLNDALVRAGKLNQDEIRCLAALPRYLHPMLMLQSMIPALCVDTNAFVDLKKQCPVREESFFKGLVIAAKLPSLIAGWYQLQQGNVSTKNSDLPQFHAHFLEQFNQQAPSDQQVSVLDIAQILQMEHGFNASAFSARVTASTEAPIQSVISAAIGTLSGRLHGGADQAALEMALEIGDVKNAREFTLNKLANKEKIMGMGHREYRVIDPRAKIIKPLAKKVCEEAGLSSVFNTLEAVELTCQDYFKQKNKNIWANVEFYKGTVFYAMNIPPSYFTALFAMARVFGYLAHFAEFRESPRVIRPHARYVGRKPENSPE